VKFIDENEAVIKMYRDEIIKQFNLPKEEAHKWAEKIISQIDAHGGSAEGEEGVEEIVSTIVGSWLKK